MKFQLSIVRIFFPAIAQRLVDLELTLSLREDYIAFLEKRTSNLINETTKLEEVITEQYLENLDAGNKIAHLEKKVEKLVDRLWDEQFELENAQYELSEERARTDRLTNLVRLKDAKIATALHAISRIRKIINK